MPPSPRAGSTRSNPATRSSIRAVRRRSPPSGRGAPVGRSRFWSAIRATTARSSTRWCRCASGGVCPLRAFPPGKAGFADASLPPDRGRPPHARSRCRWRSRRRSFSSLRDTSIRPIRALPSGSSPTRPICERSTARGNAGGLGEPADSVSRDRTEWRRARRIRIRAEGKRASGVDPAREERLENEQRWYQFRFTRRKRASAREPRPGSPPDRVLVDAAGSPAGKSTG